MRSSIFPSAKKKAPQTVGRMILAHSRYLPHSRVNYIQFQIGIRLTSVHTRTRVSKILERPEDCIDLRPLIRFPVPALLGNLPDRRGNSWSIKAVRCWWSFPLRDQDYDVGVRKFWERHISSRELKTNMIRTWTHRTFGNQTRLHNNHRQGVHIGFLRWFSLLDPYGTHRAEELGSGVTDRTAVVGGRSVDYVDVLRD